MSWPRNVTGNEAKYASASFAALPAFQSLTIPGTSAATPLRVSTEWALIWPLSYGAGANDNQISGLRMGYPLCATAQNTSDGEEEKELGAGRRIGHLRPPKGCPKSTVGKILRRELRQTV
jgi:hypothetical protein